jgi:hypothetical protein
VLVAMLALALALAVAACGGGNKTEGVASLGGSATPTTSGSKAGGGKDISNDLPQALAFGRCMRQHGDNLPDPQITLTLRQGRQGRHPGRGGHRPTGAAAARRAPRTGHPGPAGQGPDTAVGSRPGAGALQAITGTTSPPCPVNGADRSRRPGW